MFLIGAFMATCLEIPSFFGSIISFWGLILTIVAVKYLIFPKKNKKDSFV